MSKEDKINKEIEKTLALLDESKPLKADAYFYTRLKARMEAEEKERRFAGLNIGWKLLAPVFLVVIMVLNIYTASVFLTKENRTKANQEELANLFASELTLDSSQYNPILTLNK